MKNTIDISPICDCRGIEDGELHYHIQLNLYTDTCELVDLSYIMDSLTKCVKHMESMLEEMKESRKGGKNDK